MLSAVGGTHRSPTASPTENRSCQGAWLGEPVLSTVTNVAILILRTYVYLLFQKITTVLVDVAPLSFYRTASESVGWVRRSVR